MNIKKVIFGLAILLCLVTFGLYKNSSRPLFKHHQSQMLMGTIINIDVCSSNKIDARLDEAYQMAWDRIKDIGFRMSVYEAESEITHINLSKARPVMVENDTYNLIAESIKGTALTHGAFDITVRPLILSWRQAQEDNRILSAAQVNEIKEIIGPEHIQLLSDNRVLIKNGLTQLDLGAIAKGYSVDQAADIFRDNGFYQFLVDAGGDVYVSGNNCQNAKWQIGIKDPRKGNSIVDIIEVSNEAVTTSGDYERFFEIEGRKYSHIIDPKTGYPLKTGVSVTVIAPNAKEADMLSTALSVMGRDEGFKLIEKLGKDYSAFFVINDNGKVSKYSSKSFKKYLR